MQRCIGFTIPIVMAVLLFPAAGRLDLPFFWLAVLSPLPLSLIVGPRMDRDLLKERTNPPPGGKDRHLRTIGAPLMFAQLIIAGLDVGRFHWSDTVPLGLQIAGLLIFFAALALGAWAILTNRFFSPVVRIQSERGHHVITTGPYALVRHPGYASTFFSWPALSLALGSWWSLAPLAPMMTLVVRRLLIEDAFLKENLEGYQAYSERVRWRILPGVW